LSVMIVAFPLFNFVNSSNTERSAPVLDDELPALIALKDITDRYAAHPVGGSKATNIQSRSLTHRCYRLSPRMVYNFNVIKSYRYRIYPTKAQESKLDQTLALCSELYNAAVQERKEAWQRERKSIPYFDQTRQLVEIKGSRADVADIHVTVLENVLKRVHIAFDAFFRRVKQRQCPGYPRFRSARRYDSMTFRQIGNALIGNKLRLSKIGTVRIKLHRAVDGRVKTLTVKREAGRWYAIFMVECDAVRLPVSTASTGIDVGISAFATFSNGAAIANPRHYETAERRLRISRRRLARRKRGSKGRRKAVLLLQRICQHVYQQRADFHHKLSRSVVNEFGLIAVEDLNVKGLARMRLAKQVYDAGWASFIDKLCAKAEEAARTVIKVNPSGTSQVCICGARVEKTLSQRWHECSSCGLSARRDHVSAQVILERGLRFQALTSPIAECVA
jgi:putative transposase